MHSQLQIVSIYLACLLGVEPLRSQPGLCPYTPLGMKSPTPSEPTVPPKSGYATDTVSSDVVEVIADDTLSAEDVLSLYRDGRLTQKCIQRHFFQRKQLVSVSL